MIFSEDIIYIHIYIYIIIIILYLYIYILYIYIYIYNVLINVLLYKFNNVDSKATYFDENCYVMKSTVDNYGKNTVNYIYIYI